MANTPKLSDEQREGLSEEDQILLEAEFINERLQVTGRGADALARMLFIKNKKAMVEVAEKRLEKLAEEESCDCE